MAVNLTESAQEGTVEAPGEKPSTVPPDKMVRGAAKGIITDQLNKQLEKLLPSGR